MYYFYKLYCIDENVKEIYIGSTKRIKNRYKLHKSNCTNINDKSYNRKVYQYIRTNGGWDNWLMDVFDEHECLNKRVAEKVEEFYRKSMGATLNSYRCYTTPEESKLTRKQYKLQNKENQKEYQKQYILQNKEKVKKYQKQYRLNHKQNQKEYQKQYRLNHKSNHGL